ncbi:MAG: hypothetical protein CMM58_14940 [Rhodospirillaceae bacterium]|nr:hypothetical protein [Rhodospirillaceae bacterium]|tara:strand:- start:653 stop:1000 length:348 start_codon:yes stop_codon:yes gene_type:complete
MIDNYGPIIRVDVRNTGFVVLDMLTKAYAPPINPEHGWLFLWQDGRRDKNGNHIPVSKCNLTTLAEQKIIASIVKCIKKYGLSRDLEITKNVLEHPKVWRLWGAALKRYEIDTLI